MYSGYTSVAPEVTYIPLYGICVVSQSKCCIHPCGDGSQVWVHGAAPCWQVLSACSSLWNLFDLKTCTRLPCN